jgi:hypothetical protein
MNTNSMNWLTEATQSATALVHQIQAWPSAVLLGVCLIILGAMLKMLKLFPNRFIPAVLLVIGAGGTMLTGDVGKVEPTQRHPEIILAMQGLVVAFAACLTHALVLKRFEKFIPLLAGKTGDTVPPFKPEE